tara:strand:- start:761 stop:1183 length:423 start_codon:yes stop_codon:yes gene_type:complete
MINAYQTLNRKQRRRKEKKQRIAMKKNNAFVRAMYNASPSMIHEKDYVQTDCVLCGKTMKTVHDTHNAYPFTELQYAKEANTEGNTGRCCSKCDREKVLPARLSLVTKTKNLDELPFMQLDASLNIINYGTNPLARPCGV